MPRHMLTEELWSKLREILLQFSLYNKAGLRKTVEEILFRMRTGVGCALERSTRAFRKMEFCLQSLQLLVEKRHLEKALQRAENRLRSGMGLH